MSTSFLNLGAAAPPTAPSPTKNVPPQGTKKQEETPLSNPYDIHDMEAAKRAKDRIQDRFRKANNRRYIFELTEWNRQRFSPDFTRSFAASFFSLNERFRCALPEGSQIKKPNSHQGKRAKARLRSRDPHLLHGQFSSNDVTTPGQGGTHWHSCQRPGIPRYSV